MDRYDEMMLGLYRGFVPDWLPERGRELFERESLRRRCALGQSLSTSFPCALYCGQALYGPDFAQEVYSGWPEMRFTARNVITGLYLAAAQALGQHEDADAVLELLHYEAMAVRELACTPQVPRVQPALLAEAGFETWEAFRFEFATPEIQARVLLYATASAPAAFIRSYGAVARTTIVGRRLTPRGWAIRDLTAFLQPQDSEHPNGAPAVH